MERNAGIFDRCSRLICFILIAPWQEKCPDFKVSAVVKTDYSVLHGPAWAIINRLLIDGLKRNSHGDVAVELRKSTVSAIETEGPPNISPDDGRRLWRARLFLDCCRLYVADELGR